MKKWQKVLISVLGSMILLFAIGFVFCEMVY